MKNKITQEQFNMTINYVLGETYAVNEETLNKMWKIYKEKYDKPRLSFLEIEEIRKEALNQ